MVAHAPRWHARSMQSIDHNLLSPSDRVFYLETSVPPGLSLREYRRARQRRSTRWERLKRLAGSGAAPATA
jgi:hypothetical protein